VVPTGTTRAEALARAITDPRVQAAELSAVAGAAAGAGEFDRAITDPREQAAALSAVAGAAAEAGDHDRGQLLLSQAENLGRAITDPDWQAAALREVADAGEFDWGRGPRHHQPGAAGGGIDHARAAPVRSVQRTRASRGL
jgi:hypothetical protein